jgi:hypothetical protein
VSAALVAVLLFAGAGDYDALVAQGLAAGKAGQLEEAARLLDEAVALDASRPEAFVERGGLRFLESRYSDAARDLRAALERSPDDAYARDLLATALHLGGEADAALREWNRIDRPNVRTLTISGLEKTRDSVARRELCMREDAVLRLAEVRRSRLQLREAGIFDRSTLHVSPVANGQADVQVVLAERHGFAHGWGDFVITSGVAALQRRAPLRYANVAGTGVNVGAEYRWQENRPQTSGFLEWPRPFGAGFYLRGDGFRGRQLYDVGGETDARRRGFGLGLRRVLGASTVGELRYDFVRREFEDPNPLAVDGRVAGLRLRLERRFVDSRRAHVDAGVSAFGARDFLGSELEFGRLAARVEGHLVLSSPEGVAMEGSVLAAQLSVGTSAADTPFDEAFAVGASPQMELPLRGHRQAVDGILGVTPLARHVVLGNLEWRRRVLDRGPFKLGVVLFTDLAWLGDVFEGSRTSLQDVGFGLRMAIPGTGILRIDYGRGLPDATDTLSIGIGQVF